MYIKHAEISSFTFSKARKTIQLTIHYESIDNPERLTGMMGLEKNPLQDEEWLVESIQVWNEKRQRYEVINFYADTLKEELKTKLFHQLRVARTA